MRPGRKNRLGEGEFGWVPTREESVKYIEISGPDLTKDEHAKQKDIEIIEDTLGQEKDSKDDGEESDIYDQLIEAINKGNGQLQDCFLFR